MDIPDEFWPKFEKKLNELAAVYNPVYIHRLYPFMVSWFHAKDVEMILREAESRGMCTFFVEEVVDVKPNVPKQKIQGVVPTRKMLAKPRYRVPAQCSPLTI